ncbi:MAG: tetratricopeptide repeat protein, partial [Treponema sp.]|nr:tetratricopeptide repeat protein [Treponema sp.]
DLPTDDFPTGDFPAADDDDEDFGAIDMGGESPHFEASASEEPAAADDFSFENDTFDMGQDSLPETQAESDDAFASEGAIEDEDTSEGFSDTDGGIDLGGESPDFELGDTGGDFSLDGLSGMDTAGTDTGGMDAGIDDSGFDSGFETPLPDTDFGADFSDTDTSAVHEFGDLGSDFASDSIELGGESSAETELHDHDSGYSSTSFGDDDFSLSGLDDILNKTKIDLPKPQPKKGFFGRKKEKAAELPDAEDDVEEISLTQEEVDSLLRTLSLYPLNLRIICEELIAEQVILPQQLSKLIRLLVNGASVKETAAHAEQIIGKPIIIPRSFEKGTGAAFEAEQSSFAYIFIHNFLPVLKLFAFIAILGASVIYLGYRFVYTPIKAESLYKRGYERIPAGEYQRANELFHDAFTLHRKKKWFYLYAEAFRDQRRYMLAEGKYDELLRYYPRDKKGVLDYANLNTYYMMNYDKANRLLQRELLDYAPNDFHGLLAAGDNFLAWADSDPTRFYDRYEDARFCYARLLERNGWQVPIVERMMKYFIRTDNLREVLHLRVWFENSNKRKLSPESLSELGGYLLDKQLERPSGVPNPYVESIESVRAMLLQAVTEDPYLPESHYHLARYHHNLGNMYEERLTLENAIRAFDLVKQESVRRRLYRVDTHYRYANLLVNSREFFPAEEQVVKGIELYEDFLSRNLILATPQLGQLYSLQGDLEYFVKSGNMEAALRSYHVAERYGYSPPEVQYRMGAAYYQREDWRNALEYLFRVSAELPLNRRLLFALGNAAYQRGDYFAAHGYYNRLLDILEVQRIRLPVLLPNDSVQFLEVGERLMMARNNAGVINEALAAQTGNREYRSRAMAMYAESARAWDTITRHPETMTRMRLTDSPGAPSINLGYLNANNALRPNSGYNPQIFVRIDRDVLEPSRWEELVQY